MLARKPNNYFYRQLIKACTKWTKANGKRMGLSQDDDNKLGFSGDEDDGDDSVVVVDSDVDLLMSNLKDGVIAPVGYCYTSKLAFLCFGPVSKSYSPILSMGGLRNLSTEERKKGSRASIHKIQEEKAELSVLPGLDEASLSRIVCNLV